MKKKFQVIFYSSHRKPLEGSRCIFLTVFYLADPAPFPEKIIL